MSVSFILVFVPMRFGRFKARELAETCKFCQSLYADSESKCIFFSFKIYSWHQMEHLTFP